MERAETEKLKEKETNSKMGVALCVPVCVMSHVALGLIYCMQGCMYVHEHLLFAGQLFKW